MSATEPLLDATDIQGNILPGFRRNEQLLVGFTGANAEVLRRALGVFAKQLTPLSDTLPHRDARKAMFHGERAAMPKTDLWLNYALGKRATDALGLSGLAAQDTAYAAGMVPGNTGDSSLVTLTDGTPNPAAPANWVVGGSRLPLDLLLIFAADGNIEALAQPVIDAITDCGMDACYRERGQLLPGDKEHFGFRDGISNPGVLGEVEVDGARRYLTTRYGIPDRNGIAFGKPGQPLLRPGQFLFENGDLRNGSFLVFRRLRQNVEAFYADTEKLARTISASLGTSVSADVVRARIVGRWPSGQPLMRPVSDPDHPESDMAINYFDFADSLPALVLTTGEKVEGSSGDPQAIMGGRCPVWAHIRKVNPRDLPTNKGSSGQTRGFQMLRRGIPFGPLYDHAHLGSRQNAEERGLLFLAYQRSISTQFEELNSDWMNSERNPSPGGFDLLVGQKLAPSGENEGKPAQWFDATLGRTIPINTQHQWILPTGGAYLFAPSISWTTNTTLSGALT